MISVLYVDPDARIREEVSAFLTEDPETEVSALRSAYEALDLITVQHFDVIVSDFFLPVTNGQTFLEILRRTRRQTTPFIFFAKKTSHATVIEALNAGANFYLLKGPEPGKAYPLLKHFITQAVQQYRLKEELVKSGKRYRSVVEDQSEFIIRFLPDGHLVFANEAYCRYFSPDRSTLFSGGLRKEPPFSGDDGSTFLSGLSRLTPTNPLGKTESSWILPDGRETWQYWNHRAIFDGTGTVIEYQSVGRDITDQKTAERALLEALKNLNIMNSITRHDILNQLTSVFGYLECSLEACKDPAIREYLNKALGSAETIRTQILFTRDYQNIGSAAPQWQNAEQVFSRTAKSLTFPGVSFDNSLADIWIYADPLIEKVFFNLLENSLRHGGRITKIRVYSREVEEGLVILYEDDGVGVPGGAKEKIFRREYFQNTGLGLYLSREILLITGMGIVETGAEGKGVRFEIFVPKGKYGKRVDESAARVPQVQV